MSINKKTLAGLLAGLGAIALYKNRQKSGSGAIFPLPTGKVPMPNAQNPTLFSREQDEVWFAFKEAGENSPVALDKSDPAYLEQLGKISTAQAKLAGLQNSLVAQEAKAQEDDVKAQVETAKAQLQAATKAASPQGGFGDEVAAQQIDRLTSLVTAAEQNLTGAEAKLSAGGFYDYETGSRLKAEIKSTRKSVNSLKSWLTRGRKGIKPMGLNAYLDDHLGRGASSQARARYTGDKADAAWSAWEKQMEPWKKGRAQDKYTSGSEKAGPFSSDGLKDGINFESQEQKFKSGAKSKGSFDPKDPTQPFAQKVNMPSNQSKYSGGGRSRSAFDPFTGPKLD